MMTSTPRSAACTACVTVVTCSITSDPTSWACRTRSPGSPSAKETTAGRASSVQRNASVSNVCGMWLIANGRLVSFLTVSMSRLMAAVVRNSDPTPPRPPSFDTAAASSADVQVPMGAKMIGTSMPNRSQRAVFSICRLQAAMSDEGGATIPHVLSPTCASAATRGGNAHSTPRATADHEGVVAVFGDLPPEILVVAKRRDRVPDLLVILVGRRRLGVDLVRRLQASVHDGRRVRTQLRAGGDQTFQGLRIAGVVSRLHLDVGIARGGGNDRLVGLGQLVPFGQVDHEVQRGASFPPAGVIVELHHLIEAELLVVVRPDPFGGVDRAPLERRIDVAAGDLLRDHAELLQRLAGPATHAIPEAFQVFRLLELLIGPAAHLAARIAGRHAFHVEFAAERVDQLRAVAIVEPGILLTGVEPERGGAEQRPGRILPDIVIIGRVAHLDGAVLYGVEHLQCGHDLARGEGLDLE